jgi:hypothetical protein
MDHFAPPIGTRVYWDLLVKPESFFKSYAGKGVWRRLIHGRFRRLPANIPRDLD